MTSSVDQALVFPFEAAIGTSSFGLAMVDVRAGLAVAASLKKSS